jgi:hypothetical protein
MRKLRLLLGTFIGVFVLGFTHSVWVNTQTTTFNISAGASTATIQSTLNSAAATSGNVVVNFAAGNYSITSQVSIPCPSGTMTIQGPVASYVPPSNFRSGTYSYTSPYTANLNGNLTNTWGFSKKACSAGHSVTWQYTNWNGGQPSGGGGGFMFVTRGDNELTYQNNYCHGLWASTTSGHDYDTCIYLDGALSPTPVSTNESFLWNVFGDGVSDCNPIMNLTTYQGGSYDSAGGQCAGITWRASTKNLLIAHNDFEHLEQGMKGIESGQSFSSAVLLMNSKYLYNDFGQIHRIGFESQQCCAGFIGYSSDNEITIDDNTFAANAAPTGSYYPPIEWWGAGGAAGHGNNNLGQGFLGASTTDHVTYHGGSIISWGCTNPSSSPVWQAGNNILRQAYGGSVISDEGEQDPGKQCPISPKVPPTQSNNSVIASLASQPSTVPVISPTPSGSYSAPISVTITNAGNVSGQGPRGNQNSYCTLDGSTPTVSSTFYASGTVISVNPGTTVKCIGQWGSLNQPKTWPSNFGWAPSTTTTATYASGGTPTAATPTFTPPTQTFTGTISVSAASTTSGAALRCTTDGTTPTTSSALYTGPFSVSATTTIQCLATATGYLTSAVGTGIYTLAGNPTISSGYQGNTGSINTLQVGATGIQQVAYGIYSDSITRSLPDTYGNTAIWSSVTPAILNVSSSGFITCLTAGTANSRVKSSSGVNFSDWTWTCTAAPVTLSSISLTATGGNTTLTVGATNQTILLCTYSDASTDNCSTQTVNYNTTSSTIANVNGTGLVTAVAAGTANITAVIGSVTSSPVLTYTVQPTAVTLNSITVSFTDPITVLFYGQTELVTAKCLYSDGSNLTCSQSADGKGTLVTWTVDNVGAFSITSPQGVVSVPNNTTAPGQTANIIATSGSVTGSKNLKAGPKLPITFNLYGLGVTVSGTNVTLNYK